MPSRYEVAVYCQEIYYGVSICFSGTRNSWFMSFLTYKHWKLNHEFLVPKKLDSWSKKCHFRSIFGSFPVKFPRKKCFGKFLLHQKIVFEFQGESLKLFLSYRAYFCRYRHFIGFWQSTASSYRDCWQLCLPDIFIDQRFPAWHKKTDLYATVKNSFRDRDTKSSVKWSLN